MSVQQPRKMGRYGGFGVLNIDWQAGFPETESARPMSKPSRKGPTTDPSCPKRDWHHNGQRCETCGGIG